MSHVVNNAMMLKSGPLWWRLTGNEEDLRCAEDQVKLLDEYHGMVTGVFSGDECLAGKSPVQGTELCAVVEYMYSLEHLVSITGEVHWADRLELIAFNALPATFSPDMWTHQYDQQVNQVQCSRQDKPAIFSTNGVESNLFGLEPNYGCCTANLSQGWPKFALSGFMKKDDGIAAVVYAPGMITTNINGVKVSIELITDYPFDEELKFRINTDGEADFAFYMRIPGWAEGALISANFSDDRGHITEKLEAAAESGTFQRLSRKWKGESLITLRLPMRTVLVERPDSLYVIRRGPLIYSLAVGERWERTNTDIPGREFPHCDYEVYPTTPWNYGLFMSSEGIEGSLRLEKRAMGDYPFSPSGVTVLMKIKGKKIDWPYFNKSAAACPQVNSAAEETEELVLIPYGSTCLRVTEMPLVK
jgi:hypothetical protein